MIYITGDTHGERERFAESDLGDGLWTENDVLIVCGDFGYLFRDNASEKEFLDKLEAEKPYTICFCDGNHENFPAIFSYPEEEWMGGRIHRIRKNILHLMRGHVFEIQNKSFFVFGGAYSVDRAYRREGVSWWKEELPTAEEYDLGLDALEKRGFKVNYIITHTAPQAVVERLIAKQPWYERPKLELHPKEYKLMEYLGKIAFQTEFRHWYFGHWHFDTPVDDKSTAVFCRVHAL